MAMSKHLFFRLSDSARCADMRRCGTRRAALGILKHSLRPFSKNPTTGASQTCSPRSDQMSHLNYIYTLIFFNPSSRYQNLIRNQSNPVADLCLESGLGLRKLEKDILKEAKNAQK